MSAILLAEFSITSRYLWALWSFGIAVVDELRVGHDWRQKIAILTEGDGY